LDYQLFHVSPLGDSVVVLHGGCNLHFCKGQSYLAPLPTRTCHRIPFLGRHLFRSSAHSFSLGCLPFPFNLWGLWLVFSASCSRDYRVPTLMTMVS
jgi:hypothetical protein